jgi:hypothetical protein
MFLLVHAEHAEGRNQVLQLGKIIRGLGFRPECMGKSSGSGGYWQAL